MFEKHRSIAWTHFALTTVALLLLIRLFSVASVPRHFRQRRIISNVDKLSRLISLEAIDGNPKFASFVDALRSLPGSPFIIFFDSSNVDVTLNHICNLRFMPGAGERVAAVAFDVAALATLRRRHPTVPAVLVDFSRVRDQLPASLENRKYTLYQLILLLRTRVATVLARRRVDFWAMQQDTIWVENFASMNVESLYPQAQLIFDTVGNNYVPIYKRMEGWICGSTFFVRGGPIAEDFFRKVDAMMRTRQSPDSAIMTYLCGHQNFRCQKLPKWVVSSSNYFLGPRDEVPAIIQVDHESSMSKMELFRRENFEFRNSDGSCNVSAVARVRDSAKAALLEIQMTDFHDGESLPTTIFYWAKALLGIDPYNNRNFLRVHEGLV